MTPVKLLLPALLWSLLVAPFSSAQDPRQQPPEDGIFVNVYKPITSEVTNRIRNQVDEARSGKNGKTVSKIIFDFNPGVTPSGQESSSPDFGPCYDLAKYIRGLHNVMTVAYVHNKVSRHTVLPVLACKELVMGGADSSWIGKVIDDPRGKLDAAEAKVYEQFAGETRAAIVQKMFDSGVELMKGRRNNAEFYYDKRKQADALAMGVVGGETVYGPGDLLLVNTDNALKLGLAKLGNKTQRRQLLDIYGLSPESLRSDPLRGAAPNARLVTLKGDIDAGMKESLLRRLRSARENGVNTFFLVLHDVGGGDPQVAQSLAEELIKLTNDEKHPVQLIAFIPFAAPATATFIAFGCSEIVMSEDARLGNFSGWLGAKPQDLDAIKAMLRRLLEERDYDPTLADAMLDVDASIYLVHSRQGAFERRLMTGDELKSDSRLPQPLWQEEKLLKHPGTVLELTADVARSLKVARHVVKGHDVREVYSEYGLVAEQVKEITPDWLDQIASFLRNPVVRFFLVMIGITCLILEFKIPGATAPGVIAAICFVLFFWASANQISGQIIILAILLFLLGLILIAIEIFVLPGFGFVGISGVLLIVIGLGLATVERAPQSGSDWIDLGAKFTQFGIGIILAGFSAIILARYLPSIPWANRMVLPPPSEGESADDVHSLPGASQAAALLGAVGTAATMLRPAGMAMFGEQYVDVVTEGSFIPAGARVQVIEVEGNRIVVKEV
jgi:membrane-bound serine protease (ClpP class)